VMKSRHPERIIPKETAPGPLAAHLVRYQFALPRCEGKRVLDAACGVGYGSHMLGRVAAEVVGIDVSEEAIAYATSHYAGAGTSFRLMNVERLEFGPEEFDVVCSFETIEHVSDPEAFVGGVARVLRHDGVLLMSTPHVPRTNRAPDNPFHTIEYSREDFSELLGRHFGKVQILGQRRRQSTLHRSLQKLDVFRLRTRIPRGMRSQVSIATGTRSWEESGLDDFLIDGELRFASELVAVCTEPKAGGD
jgi:SAM-dependent methyltransferase